MCLRSNLNFGHASKYFQLEIITLIKLAIEMNLCASGTATEDGKFECSCNQNGAGLSWANNSLKCSSLLQ